MVCLSTLFTFLLTEKHWEFSPGQTLWWGCVGGVQMSQVPIRPIQIMVGSSILAMRLLVSPLG